MPRINRECREHLSWATKSNLAHKVCIFQQRYPSTQVINMYFKSNSSHAGRKTSVPNIWHPFYPGREGPFPTSLSLLEALQKVVVRASQGNGVSLWERSDLLKSLSRPAQVSLQCRWPGSKVPSFPTVQSPESHQVHIGVVV